MKFLLLAALLLIGWSVVSNWRRASRAYGQFKSRQDQLSNNDEIMRKFGEKRVRLSELRVEYLEVTGVNSVGDPAWNFVDTSVKNSHDALGQFKFEQAFHFMTYAVDHAQRIVDHERRNSAPIDPSIV